MTLDLSKPVQTRDGRPVRILCTDARKALYPIIGLIQYQDGSEALSTWADGGVYNLPKESAWDLVNVPPKMVKVKVEVRLFRGSNGNVLSESWVGLHECPNWINDYIARQVIEMEYEEPRS